MKRILAAACLAFATAAAAQSGPARPVRIVVAYPPGGGIDILGRQLAERLTAAWAQPVVVENRPGANTIVAADAVAKAAPDGHTVLLTTDATFCINPHLYARLPFDTQRDFIPVTMLVLLQQLLVAHPSLPANSLQELIRLAKDKPGSINYASYGSGSQPHLSGEMLKYQAGIDLVHVPYKGISLAVPAVMAGEVQLTFAGIATSMFAVPASAAVGYYVIRWDNTGICQVWNEDLKYKPFQWGTSTYKIVSKPLPTFTAASDLQIKLRAERRCTL